MSINSSSQNMQNKFGQCIGNLLKKKDSNYSQWKQNRILDSINTECFIYYFRNEVWIGKLRLPLCFRTYSLKFEDFEKAFHDYFINHQKFLQENCWMKVAEGMFFYISFCSRYLGWGLVYTKPTYYVLDYGDFNDTKIQYAEFQKFPAEISLKVKSWVF